MTDRSDVSDFFGRGVYLNGELMGDGSGADAMDMATDRHCWLSRLATAVHATPELATPFTTHELNAMSIIEFERRVREYRASHNLD